MTLSAQARINSIVDDELFARVKGKTKTMQTWKARGGKAYVIVIENTETAPVVLDAVAALMKDHK